MTYTHEFFKKHFQFSTKLQLELPGVCAGFASAAKLYFLSGELEFRIFKEIIDYISKQDPTILRQNIENLRKNKAEKKDLLLSKEEQILEEVDIFFDIAVTFSEPKHKEAEIGKRLSQPKIDEIIEHIKKKYPGRFLKERKVTSTSRMFKRDEKHSPYEQFLKKISQAATQDPPCRVSLVLDSYEHRITLSYDGDTNLWFLGDINQLRKIDKSIAPAELVKETMNALQDSAEAKVVGFDIAVYTNAAPDQLKRFEDCVTFLNSIPLLPITTPKGVNLAHLAAKFGYKNIMEKLSKDQKDLLTTPTNSGHTSLFISIEQHQIEVIKCLLDAKIDPKNELFLAAERGDHVMVETLLEAKVDPNIKMAEGLTPVYMATQHGRLKVLEVLLKAKANPDTGLADGTTPIFMAAQEGYHELVKALVEAKADPNSATLDNGTTPLFMAANEGHFEAVKILAKAKGNLNIERQDGLTPILTAIAHNNVKMVKVLAKNKAELNKRQYCLSKL